MVREVDIVVSSSSITLSCSILRQGHKHVFARGTAVKCALDVDVCLFTELGDVSMFGTDPTEMVSMKSAGVGLVMDSRYHISPLELCRSDITAPNPGEVAHIEGAVENLWYLVMFKKGHFWARYDWLVPVEAPVPNKP